MIMPKNILAFCSVAFLICAPGLAFAGKFSGEKVKPEMTYKITECERPDNPKIKGDTLEEYNASIVVYEAYVSAQNAFATCIEREVGEDLKALQEIVFVGGQSAIGQSQRDIDRIKHELDFLRSHLVKAAQ